MHLLTPAVASSLLLLLPAALAKTTSFPTTSPTITPASTAAQPPASLLPPLVNYSVDASACDLGCGGAAEVSVRNAPLAGGSDGIQIQFGSFPFATPITYDEDLPPTNCSVLVRYAVGPATTAGWTAAFAAAEFAGHTDLKNGSWIPWMNVSTEFSPDGGLSWIEKAFGTAAAAIGSTAEADGDFDIETNPLDPTVWSPCGLTGDLLVRVNVSGRLVRWDDITTYDSPDELSVPGTLTNSLGVEWKSDACVTLTATVPF